MKKLLAILLLLPTLTQAYNLEFGVYTDHLFSQGEGYENNEMIGFSAPVTETYDGFIATFNNSYRKRSYALGIDYTEYNLRVGVATGYEDTSLGLDYMPIFAPYYKVGPVLVQWTNLNIISVSLNANF